MEPRPSRSAFFQTDDGGPRLNYETWEQHGTNPSALTVVFFHGICESAETLAVQVLAHAVVARGWRLVVLEFAGHGLSHGPRVLVRDFNQIVEQSTAFVQHLRRELGQACPRTGVPFVLTGHSFGGTVAAYCADRFAPSSRITGAVLFAPAVGVDPEYLPPPFVRQTLRNLERFFPTWAPPATPYEDPSHYACPPGSKRNYKGHWPLATSRMLLDMVEAVPRDQADGYLKLECPLLVLAASRDAATPVGCAHAFADAARSVRKGFVVCDATHSIIHGGEAAHRIVRLALDWIADLSRETLRGRNGVALFPPLHYESTFTPAGDEAVWLAPDVRERLRAVKAENGVTYDYLA